MNSECGSGTTYNLLSATYRERSAGVYNMQDSNRSVFTPAEIVYLQSQRLGRLATVGAHGQPHVVPVAFRYNPETDTIDIGGHRFGSSKKWRDGQRHPRVAFVVDDIASTDPWTVRGIEIRGEVEVLMIGGETVRPGFYKEMFRLKPTRIASWGVDTHWFAAPHARTVAKKGDS